jgi:glycerate 2-kinase
MRILIVPDKFKGTLTARQAAEAMGRGWASIRPSDELELLPMSDGGDGFGEIISQMIGAEPQTIKTVDAAHRPIESLWWWAPDSKTAIIESARIIGLALLPRGKYHPFELDTFGLGAVLEAAMMKGAKRALVGIGGSATNDGGFGAARALGWQFFNTHDEEIERWTNLRFLSQVRPPKDLKRPPDVTVAVDVQNPLLGQRGCSRVYGPQKGLRPEEFQFAEEALIRLASIMRQELHLSCATLRGAGAAGGLGYGLRCFAEAQLEPGFALFSGHAKLLERISRADVIITGEGAIDRSTVMGKGVGEVARACALEKKPCIGLAGITPDLADTRALFTQLHALVPTMTTSDHAMADGATWLERLAAQVARGWKS